ncbi:hypothetical protein PybrP1_011717 [[Pythium] brassicae (nom. inval.)]|nr:hypothetical protein PybrP1_011717 [[Pythium] brassicae (nom. inval.)]
MAPYERSRALQPASAGDRHGGDGAWWCGAASSESELLSAAVLCAAIAAADSPMPSSPSGGERADDQDDLVRARKELELRVRQSPLSHDLLFPVLEFHHDYVLMETTRSVVCALRATKHRDVLDAVLGSTVPLVQPYEIRFGGARVHSPFWKRAQRLDLQAAHRRAKRAKKMLLLCGHSIGGSIAQLGLCELVYQHLPTSVRLQMEKLDFEQTTRARDELQTPPTLAQTRERMRKLLEAHPDQAALFQNVPNVMAVGFGSPYSSSHEISAFLEPFGMTKRMVTFVNEFDCIPAVLNVAQSAAMIAKTTERVVTITKATTTLLKLLPARMQHALAGLSTASSAATSTSGLPSATSAYLAMSLNILQNTFQKLRDYNIVKDASSLQYAPCGAYVFLKKRGSEFQIFYDVHEILEALHADSDVTLTGNSILQHLMSAYVDAVAKRCTSIQVNASMNYYERLNVPRNATQREIRSAYRALALKWHPDRWSHRQHTAAAAAPTQEQEMAEHVFKLLAESYEVLSDPVARKAYDAHLARAPSLAEEFVRDGTVNGMTLDEAITVFREMFDRGSGVVSRASSRFSSSSSSALGQRIRRSGQSETLATNNHDNLFAPDRIRVSRKTPVGSGLAEQQDTIMYLRPDEVLPGDLPAPSGTAAKASSAGLRTVSVVGGAVAVGAGVALIVSAWSQYSESSKRQRQAETVRNMSGDHLLLLMEDHLSTARTTRRSGQATTKKTDESSAITTGEGQQPEVPAASAATRDQPLTSIQESSVTGEVTTIVTTAAANEIVATKAEDAEGEDAGELALINEFYECSAGFDAAALEAFAEDEFYDCVDIAEDMTEFFSDDDTSEFFDANSGDSTLRTDIEDADDVDRDENALVLPQGGVLFPEGSTVATPFGLGTVETWREGCSSAAVRFNEHTVGYIQKSDLKRGAALALEAARKSLERKRGELAERVVTSYQLDSASTSATANFQAIVRASKDGALDSGLRAAGGVALAKGMARTSTALGGAVAAPLTIASILVDIGKEYYSYRTKHTERKSQGVLSDTSERLLMKDFRLKAGQHIAGGTAAAAGASLGAYSVASAVGFWTGVGITGPIGVVAATGAAVVGGMLGFLAGTKAYNGYTASYFHSHQHAKEHIDRLELGARIMFNEYDPEGNGEISKQHCIQIMTKLYEASSAVSENGYQQTVDVLQSESFEGPVTWGMFWEWVSTEAARSLRALEHEEAKPLNELVAGESWWTSYMTYFSYGAPNAATTPAPELATPQDGMYPSVELVLGFKFRAVEVTEHCTVTFAVEEEEDADDVRAADEAADNLVVVRAQLEALVNSGDVTVGDAFQLRESLDSDDSDVRESARCTIRALQNGQADSGFDSSGLISEGFAGESAVVAAEPDGATLHTAVVPTRDSKAGTAVGKPSGTKAATALAKDEEEIDVLCSLLSTHGLREYLHAHHIEPATDTRRHEDLHCLALQAALPSSPAAVTRRK